MRVHLALLLWCAATVQSFAEDVIHFVALAGVKPGKEMQYDAFIDAVAPVWKRHGMSVVARARPVGPFAQHRGTVDLTVLRVDSRNGFYAYANDPEYKALQGQRLEAVDFLAVFDGKIDMSDETELRESALLRVWFVATPASTWGKMLASDLSEPANAALQIDLGIVGQVKGPLDEALARTRTIHVEAIDDPGPVQPPYLAGMRVLSGLRLQ